MITGLCKLSPVNDHGTLKLSPVIIHGTQEWSLYVEFPATGYGFPLPQKIRCYFAILPLLHQVPRQFLGISPFGSIFE